MKTLIAEDDLTSRTVLTGILKRNGHEVIAVANGAKAWELLQQPDAPSLVILDWMMPEMDGLEVVRRVRALQTNRPPYIIMVTAKDRKADIVTSLAAGANDYMSKPFDFGELLARVEVGRRMIEMQDKQRKSEEMYRLLIENTHDIIYAITADGVFTFVSPAWTMLLGHQTTQIVGRHFQEFVHPDDLPKCMELLQNVIDTGQRQESVEYRVRHINGSWRWHTSDGSTSVKNETGTVIYYQAIARDITERKQAEEKREELEKQIRHSQKMEAIGQLASGIAHDFNNQLASIIGYADMLYKRLDDPSLKSKAGKIIRSSERSADLIKNLMAFSRKGKYLTVPINVNKIINEVTSLIARTIDRKIKIKRVLNSNSANISGDPSQIENALLNLALNARDAMPDGGKIVFATEDIDMEDVPMGTEERQKAIKGRYLKISVIDSGTGMDEEVKKHLYEPFFTTRPQGKGTGMGLASVYGAVQNHNGVICVTSELGKGTEFSLFFPLVVEGVESKDEEIEEDKTALKNAAYTPTATDKGSKILLADDEEMLRDMVSEVLSSCGYEIIACKDGLEAVEIYRREWKDIDLVILDMMMPEMNGKDAFLEMQSINRNVQALLISGFSIEGDAQDLLDAGMKGFIPKPFDTEILLKTVQDALKEK